MTARAEDYLEQLAGRYPDRSVGSAGNLAATDLFARVVGGFGFEVALTSFECVTWQPGSASLECGGIRPELHIGPYSLPCDLRTPLVAVSSVEELESEVVRGAVVLMHGGLASGQYMPRNFTFYNPDSHRRVYRALDDFEPAVVLAATGRDLEMVGSQYPFNVFEDGDLDVPNAYLRDVDGERLLAHAGAEAHVRIESLRVPSVGEHVVATVRGDRPGRVVVFAHIDSKQGSPGAIDNAAGVATLLVLAGLLRSREGGLTVELVPLNGEDNYANPGEMMWVAENEGRMDDIVLGINVDDAGRLGQETQVSFYDVPPGIDRVVRGAMKAHAGFEEGRQWFQSDHAIFGMYGRPAIAIASSDMEGFMAQACHTERDTVELADPSAIVEIAGFLREVIDGLVGAGNP